MLKIFNTLGRELQDFKPIENLKVKFYQCGPTVYSHQHIGNLFSAVKGDLVRRSLKYLGFDVKYVRNITDVGHLVSDEDSGEDKLEKGAKREGLSPEEIAKKYTEIYHNDLKKLNVLAPDIETIATRYIDEMAEMVQILIDKGFAYGTSKAIYFDVSKANEYTKLSGQKLDKNILGSGHGKVEDTEKRNPWDFAVWFYKTGEHKSALQTWNKIFQGVNQEIQEGFPGWHIECSAMAKDTLGNTIDIHMGGMEHIPIHHTNEIAQSESANGTTFANYWIHHEMLTIDGGKMAKSSGKVYTLDNLIEKDFEPLVYRYFVLQSQHRSKQNFTFEALEASKTAYERLINFLKTYLKESNSKPSSGKVSVEYKNKFIEALENDFNIPMALSLVWEITKSELSSQEKLETILDFDKVLGLNLEERIMQKNSVDLTPEIKSLIEERNMARNNKDWKKSDEIRDRLKKEFNFEVKDERLI